MQPLYSEQRLISRDLYIWRAVTPRIATHRQSSIRRARFFSNHYFTVGAGILLFSLPNCERSKMSVLQSSTVAVCRIALGNACRKQKQQDKNSAGNRIIRNCNVHTNTSKASSDSSSSSWTTSVKSGSEKIEICRVINGMWQTSGGWGRIDANSAVDAMLKYADNGFTTFDMADHYGPAEDLHGLFINRVRRERPPEILHAIKGLTKWVPPPVKIDRDFVNRSIAVSLKRMDVESLDMLQFHWWDYSNPGYLDALKFLTDLKEAGKIKALALTNFDTKRLETILNNGIPVASNQVQHSVVDMRPQRQMKDLCEHAGVKLITYGTVMGGLLSEKFLDANVSIPFAGPSLNTPSLQKYKRMVDAWGGWSLFQQLLQTLNTVAKKHAVSIPAVAVRYILDQPAVAGSMIGVRLGLSEHIDDSKKIFSLALDEEDMHAISEVSGKGKDLLKVIGDCGDEYRR